MIPVIDWPALTQAELDELLAAFNAEVHRRHVLATADDTLDELGQVVLDRDELIPGDPWRQPVTIGYPRGWEVTHNGKRWTSTVANNVWEPGVSGWRELVEGGGAPPWTQPTGAHDAYQTGDRVTFEGAIYESKIDNNTWSPAAYPAGWLRITE